MADTGDRRGKYAALIDAETWAYIDAVDALTPPDATGWTIARQREVYDAMARHFHCGRPEGVIADDLAVPSPAGAIPVRSYRLEEAEPAAQVVYFHGGGFVLGGLDSHDDVCAEICAGTGFDVFSVDYRLAPEHRHPAQFDDALAAFRWIAGQSRLPVILAGDSAGGTLAASVAHAVRGEARRPVGQMLIYPGLGGDMARGSYLDHAQAPMLSTDDVRYYRDVRTGGMGAGRDPTLAPLDDADVSGLPPTVIVTAQCDPLSSDGETYRDRLLQAGGRAVWREEPGLPHSFLRARRSVGRARDAFARIVADIAALGR